MRAYVTVCARVRVQAQNNLVVPQEPSSTPVTQAACTEEKADQVSPGSIVHSDSPSTPATVPEGDASPVASTAQIAQTALEAAGEEPAGDSRPADAVDGQGGLRWSLVESKLDRALQALASLAASVDGRLSTVDGRLDEISASLGTPAAGRITRVDLTEGT